MVRPTDAALEAAQRAKAAREAAVQKQGAHGGGVADTTHGGRSATLPPDPGGFEAASAPPPAPTMTDVRRAAAWPVPQLTAATMPRSEEPTMQGREDSAAARASLELASRRTLPWKRAQDVTPSPTASQRGRSLFEGPRELRVPMWVAPLLGMVLTLVVFLAIRIARAPSRPAGEQVNPIAVAGLTAAPAPASRGTTTPTATVVASTSAAPPTTVVDAPAAAAAPAAPAATVASAAASMTAPPVPARKSLPVPAVKPMPDKIESDPEPMFVRRKPETQAPAATAPTPTPTPTPTESKPAIAGHRIF
jgi:hypothetical protein